MPAHSKKNKKLGITEKEYERIMRHYHQYFAYFDEYEFIKPTEAEMAKWCTSVASIMRRTGHLKSLHWRSTKKHKSKKRKKYKKSR